jgi:hypothetical protein
MIVSSWFHSSNEFPITMKQSYDENDNEKSSSETEQQEQYLLSALCTEINSVVLSKHTDSTTEAMIPAQYFQQITLGKRQFFREVQILPILETSGCRLSLHSQTIRFRRNLFAFEAYKMIIRVSAWNDNDYSFILEILFSDSESCSVCAVHYSRYFIVANFTANEEEIVESVPILTPYDLFSKVILSNSPTQATEGLPSEPVRSVSEESYSSVQSFQSTASFSSFASTSSLMSEKEKDCLMKDVNDSPITVFWGDFSC